MRKFIIFLIVIVFSCNTTYTYKLKIYMQDGTIVYNTYNGYHNGDPTHNDIYLINSCIRRGNEDIICGVKTFEIIEKIENK